MQKVIFILMLAFIICTPGLILLFKIDTPQPYIFENRPMAAFPNPLSTPINKFPAEFEKYFNDNIGFRNVIISNALWLQEWILGSPLRYAYKGERFGLYALGTVIKFENPVSQAQLYKCRALFAGEQAYLTQRGIKC